MNYFIGCAFDVDCRSMVRKDEHELGFRNPSFDEIEEFKTLRVVK